MKRHDKLAETIPVGNLGIIALESSREMGKKVNDYIVEWRKERSKLNAPASSILGYSRDTYLIESSCPRFGSGEAKGLINETVRGDDLFLLVDVVNHSLTYKVCGRENHMSPDDHYQDLKRIIAAVGGKARRITVIMPFLYESRQHRRSTRESLDCALALHELSNMGVESIITFDAHDPRVQNSIPLRSFETVQPTYQFIKALLKNIPDIKLDKEHMMVVSPDEGAMGRAVYYATLLGLDVGMFYKRRDYSRIEGGRNPIVAHEFLGADLEGKDVFIIDDMISSGESMIDVATELKRRNANNIYVAATFGLFTSGMEKFDEAVEKNIISKVLTTNLVYTPEEVLKRDYYISVDMSKYVALLIDTLNHDQSISGLLSPTERIQDIMHKYHQSGFED
ncbi:MAG: ribose-phosphate pyrophosphokinase [Lachnospiraceae bacterium]|nr:ribose-phosphate pyrophosphokinase [Lachnospiraceae bacterium]